MREAQRVPRQIDQDLAEQPRVRLDGDGRHWNLAAQHYPGGARLTLQLVEDLADERVQPHRAALARHASRSDLGNVDAVIHELEQILTIPLHAIEVRQ